jgi:4-hydroxybenzoate polyprenyltransferase
MTMAAAEPTPRAARLSDYLRLARFDHVTKHVFILPGVALAVILRGVQNESLVTHVVLGMVCAVCIASANYVINEWLDRDFDKHHPTKSARVSVQVPLKPGLVYGLWLILASAGLAAAALSSTTMLVVGGLFLSQGIFYNVPPLRTKDRAILDVLSEAVNNPFRLMIGWAMIDAATIPPSSIIIAYWLGGAFLMAAKRLSEYRDIVASHGAELLAQYRKSFAQYTESRLLVSCFAYALLSVALFAVFMIKYRVEYLLLTPFLCLLFCVYLSLSMWPGSVAQAPERLFQERGLMITVLLFVVAAGVLTLVDIPVLSMFTEQNFIRIQ